jgi:hypothetical protein
MEDPKIVLEPVYTLKQAVEKFFPDGPLTVASLRNEIRKGRLQATMPAGKLLVTERALAEMLERCRVAANLPDSISSTASRRGSPSTSSETERLNIARDAVETILTGRAKP